MQQQHASNHAAASHHSCVQLQHQLQLQVQQHHVTRQLVRSRLVSAAALGGRRAACNSSSRALLQLQQPARCHVQQQQQQPLHHHLQQARVACGAQRPPQPCSSSSTRRSLQQQHPRHARLPSPAAAAASAAAAGDFGGEDAVKQQLPQQPQQQRQQAAPPASSTWQPPLRPRSLAGLPSISLWQLGGPLAWAYMLGYLAVMLVLPITALLAKASLVPLADFLSRATEPVALSAYFVSFSMALLAGAVNAVFGFLLAWVLVKYDFPGKKWVDAAVDLPFALPTSVAGLTLATVYGEEGLLGRLLMSLGVNVVYTRLGVAVAMIFVSFPFVVRTMQPVLQEMEREVEEAAWSLGASPWQTFTQVLLPPLLPPLLTGTALAFSRALGEFGSVVIVSSNFPFKDLIAPVLIFQCLEQYDFVGATVIGSVLLLISLVMMVGVNWLQSYSQRFRK